MRKFWIPLLLLCLLPVCALATQIEEIPAGSYEVQIFKGTKVDQLEQNAGLATLRINTEETDWQTLLSNSYDPTHPQVRVLVSENCVPAGAETMQSFNGNGFESDEQALDMFRMFEEELGDFGYDHLYGDVGSVEIAQYVAAQDCIQPREDFTWVYLRWYDGNHNPLKTASVKVEVSHTRTNAFHVSPLPKLPASRIRANMWGASNLEASYQDGTLTYTASGISDADDVCTGIVAPSGAVAWKEQESSDVRFLEEGCAAVYYPVNTERGDMFTSRIDFLNAAEEVVESVSLTVHISPVPSSLPWTDYNTLGWEAVPPANLKIQNGAASAGYVMEYKNGILHSSFEGDASSIASMDMAQVTVSVAAPAGAKSARTNNSGMNNYLGMQDEERYLEQEAFVRNSDIIPLTDGCIETQGGDAFNQIELEEENLTLYLPWSFETAYLFGETMLIFWYAEEEPSENAVPIAKQYYNHTNEMFVLESVTAAVTPDNIPDDLKEPIVVDRHGRQWWLHIRHYFQSGDCARHYELLLMDDNGQLVRLGENETVTVYLPYPEGCSKDDDYEYCLRHYGLEMYDFGEQQHEELTIHKADKGLWFETNSFSPYVLSWEESLPEGAEIITAAIPLEMLDEVPGRLGETENWDTIEEIISCLTEYMLWMDSEIAPENIAFYDVIPLYHVDGRNPIPVTPDNWPLDENGDPVMILANVPYPEGTGSVGYDFTLLHMQAEEMGGRLPGAINFPEIVRTDEDGIWFYADSLSPVAVGWKVHKAESLPPRTGDSTPVMLLCLMAALSGMVLILMVRRRRHS